MKIQNTAGADEIRVILSSGSENLFDAAGTSVENIISAIEKQVAHQHIGSSPNFESAIFRKPEGNKPKGSSSS